MSHAEHLLEEAKRLPLCDRVLLEECADLLRDLELIKKLLLARHNPMISTVLDDAARDRNRWRERAESWV